MARKSSSTQKPVDAPELQSIPVVRDPGFCRLTLDESVVVSLGSEFEIACLVAGGAVKRIDFVGETQQVHADMAWSEVARIRLGALEAANLGMRLLGVGLASGQISPDELVANISRMAALAAANRRGEGESDDAD